MSSSKEKILNRLRKAQNKRGGQNIVRPDFGAPIYHTPDKKLTDSFQSNLELVGGQVYRVKNLAKAIDKLKKIAQQENFDAPVCLEIELQEALKGKLEYKPNLSNLENIQVGITGCEFLVAHLGAIVVSSGTKSGRRMNVFPEIHFVIAHTNQVVRYLDEALEQMEEKYSDKLPSMITTITGPSRTADIEKTLVMGMHGPKKLFVFLADEPF